MNNKPLINFSPESIQHTTNQISCISKTEELLMSLIYGQISPQLWVETKKWGEEKIPVLPAELKRYLSIGMTTGYQALLTNIMF